MLKAMFSWILKFKMLSVLILLYFAFCIFAYYKICEDPQINDSGYEFLNVTMNEVFERDSQEEKEYRDYVDSYWDNDRKITESEFELILKKYKELKTRYFLNHK